MIIESLVGTLLGGVLRLVPEGLKFWQSSKDADHEYRMAQLNLETAKFQSQARIDITKLQGQNALDVTELQGLIEATKAQGQLTGIKLIDAINQTVRPVTTYYYLALYGMVKLAAYVGYVDDGVRWTEAMDRLWSSQDMSVLASIISFWFMDRALRNRH